MTKAIKFTKKEKEVVGILSLGTFLEYFDLYLYLHFATVLNSMFFAPSDLRSSFMLTSFAYCTAYVFRPVGAIIFGHIGDKYGRKVVINITLTMMGISCLGLYFLPTYNEIGVWASVMITLFRIIQGMSTMGEIIGGEIYLVEFLKGRKAFIGVALLTLISGVACQVALYGISFALNGTIDFRNLFLVGLSIFIVGYFARRNLDESSEFIQAKTTKAENKQKISWKSYISIFFLETLQPVMFFVCFIGINNILREDHGYTESDIIARNLGVIYCHMAYMVMAIIAYRWISPYKITMVRNSLALLLMTSAPFLILYYDNVNVIIVVQSLLGFLCLSNIGILAIVSRNIPVLSRFKVCAMGYAAAKAVIAIVISFGINILYPILGVWTLSLFGLPFVVAYFFALTHFARLDKANKRGLLKSYV